MIVNRTVYFWGESVCLFIYLQLHCPVHVLKTLNIQVGMVPDLLWEYTNTDCTEKV
jgi:hypothetical protein